jgi:hypothetical protein
MSMKIFISSFCSFLILSTGLIAAELLEAQVSSFIEQLGAADYRNREQADSQLYDLGLAIRPALEAGMKHDDPEIRSRCGRILQRLLDQEFQHCLIQFEKDVDGSKQTTLPGWESFGELLRRESDSRRLFLKMQRAQRKKLAQFAADSDPQ